jgi:hypothetical protein
MEISNGDKTYLIDKLVGENEAYRLYVCIDSATGRECLLQVATDTTCNGQLSRNAYILKELERSSVKLEEEYAKVKKNPNSMLNYQLSFPELIDSFDSPQQGDRRINVLAFRCVEKIGDIIPLINISERDGLRVDLRTSAWIMGKLLKTIAMAQNEGISMVSVLSDDNILIVPDQHYVIIFDWSKAKTYQTAEAYRLEERRIEISMAARAVIKVLGGNIESGYFPDDGEKAFEAYAKYLLRLETGVAGSAEKALRQFYDFIDRLWERKFHPFTTKPL